MTLPETCPKCGFDGRTPDGNLGVWGPPRYLDYPALGKAEYVDKLSHECKQCGYKIETPCLDAT